MTKYWSKWSYTICGRRIVCAIGHAHPCIINSYCMVAVQSLLIHPWLVRVHCRHSNWYRNCSL